MNEQQIQTAIICVMKDIASTGISKRMRNQQQGYNFRGIEDAMNEISPLLVKHGITVTPRYSDISITERIKGNPEDAKATRFCVLKGSFTFSAGDGSSVISEYFGEAMDSGDKAVTKAQSVAFRTALFQQFVVPTVAIDPEAFDDHGEEDDPAKEITDRWLKAVTEAESEKDVREAWKMAAPELRATKNVGAFKQVKEAVENRIADFKSSGAK
jgi:hypothetical protein